MFRFSRTVVTRCSSAAFSSLASSTSMSVALRGATSVASSSAALHPLERVAVRSCATTPAGEAAADVAVAGSSVSSEGATANGPLGARRMGHFVLNTLNGRHMKASHPLMRSLAAVGIGADGHNAALSVVDPAALDEFAAAVRTGAAEVPVIWGGRVRKMLELALRSDTPVERVTELLESRRTLMANRRSDREAARAAAGSIGGLADDADANVHLRTAEQGPVEQLSAEQQRVVDLALQGYHMYIGGDAGTGKTVVLKAVRRALAERRLVVATTATTGLAACHLGGCTWHHYFKVDLRGNVGATSKAGLKHVDVVIIDEVSMLSGALFNAFEKYLRSERNNDLPFGGVQIIVCGDFLQLSAATPAWASDKRAIVEIECFKRHFLCVRLTQQVRQSANPAFAAVLQVLRKGRIAENLKEVVRCVPSLSDLPTTDTDAIRLMPRNKDVAAANTARLDQLEGELATFAASAESPVLVGAWSSTVVLETAPGFNETTFRSTVHGLLSAAAAADGASGGAAGAEPVTFEDLHAAAQLRVDDVVLYRSHDDGHVLRLRLPEGPMNSSLRALLARRWDSVLPRLNAIAPGTAKVLDIVVSGDGLHTAEMETRLQEMADLHPIASGLNVKVGAPVLLRANLSTTLVNGSVGDIVGFIPAVKDNIPKYMQQMEHVMRSLDAYVQHARFSQGIETPMLPVVRFRGTNTETVIPPWTFTVGGDAATSYFAMEVVCLPLSLAYAFTIHKVQGLTLLGDVRVELDALWDNCEHIVYVALSRVRSPDQLTVTGLRDSLVVANQTCVKFTDALTPVEDASPAATLPRALWVTLLAAGDAAATTSASTHGAGAVRSGVIYEKGSRGVVAGKAAKFLESKRKPTGAPRKTRGPSKKKAASTMVASADSATASTEQSVQSVLASLLAQRQKTAAAAAAASVDGPASGTPEPAQ